MFPQDKIKELALNECEKENQTWIVNHVECLNKNSQNCQPKLPLGDVNVSINLTKKGNLSAKLLDKTIEKNIDCAIFSQQKLHTNVKRLRKNTSDFKLKSLELISQKESNKKDLTLKKVSTRNTNTNFSFSPIERSFSKSNKLRNLKMSSSKREALLSFEFSKKSALGCTETSALPEITNKNTTVSEKATLNPNSVDHKSVSPWSSKRKLSFISPILTSHSKKTKTYQCTMSKENKDRGDEILFASGNSQYLSPVLGGFQYLTNFKDDCETILSPVLGSSWNPDKNKLKGELIRSSWPAVNYSLEPSQEPPSPVLDSSQYKTRFSSGKQHLSMTAATQELPQQQSVIESLSPVLDSSQFRKIEFKNKNNYNFNKDKLKNISSSQQTVSIGPSNKKLSLRSKKVKHHVHTPFKTRKCYTGKKKNSPFRGDQSKTEVLNFPHDFDITSQGGSLVLSPILDSSQFTNNFPINSKNKKTSLKEMPCNEKDLILSPSQQITKLTDNVEPSSPVLDSSQYMKTFAVKSSERKQSLKSILTLTDFKNVSILSQSGTTTQPLSPVLDSNQYKCKLPILAEICDNKTEQFNFPVIPIKANEKSTASYTSFSSPVHEYFQSRKGFSMNPNEKTNEENLLLMSLRVNGQPQNRNDELFSKAPEKSSIELKCRDQSLSPILDSSQDYKKFLVKLTDDTKITVPQTITKEYLVQRAFLLQLSKDSETLKNMEKTYGESSKMFSLEQFDLSPTKLAFKSPYDDNLISPSNALYISDETTVPFFSTNHLGAEEMVLSDHKLRGTSQSLVLPSRYSSKVNSEKYMKEYVEPMLDTVLPSNKCVEDSLDETSKLGNGLDYNELNSHSKDMKRKFTLPSCNSELDITQFPLVLSQSGVISSSLLSCVSNPSRSNTSTNKQASPGSIVKNKGFSIECSKEDCIDSENKNLSLVLNSNYRCHDPCNDSNSNSTKDQEEKNGNSKTILQKEPENSAGGSRKRPTTKKKVKKRLTLLYEDDGNSQTNTFKGPYNRYRPSKSFDDEKTVNDEENGEDVLSGVEQLPETSVCDEDLQFKKLKKTCIHEKVMSQQNLSPTTNDQCSSSRQNKRRTWRIPVESFEVHQDVYIEDFDEESPYNQNNSEITEVDQINSIKRNLIYSLDISGLSTKSSVPDRTNVLPVVADRMNDFESEIHNTNGSLTEPRADAEIQEDLTQESVKSQPFQIECSTSPTTKSSEGTQFEGGSGTISFPPPLNIPASTNPTPTDLLDSASKTRRARVKKGSLLDRLRRVVRAERAEVNMFQHEGPPRLPTTACTLQVLSVTTACTNLLLHTVRRNTSPTINPDELSAGEEVVDSEVRVFIDPLYAKQVTPGSTLLVYPPWQTDWQEGRGLVMFGVSRVRVHGHVDTPPLPAPPTTRHGSLLIPSTLHKFQCQGKDELCGCRQQLVSQLLGGVVQTTPGVGPAAGSVKAALISGKLPGPCTLTLTPLHRFHFRNRNKRVVAGLLCLDSNNDVCQVNLNTSEDEKKIADLLENVEHKTLMFQKMGLCKRVFIDRYQGLRSILSQLWPESVSQPLMYVISPASDEWLVKTTSSATDHRRAEIATLSDTEGLADVRVQARVQVMALRGEQLIVWNKTSDRYSRISVSPAAVLPPFAARDSLHLTHLWVFNAGELIIDKFTSVSVTQTTSEDPPSTVPPLSSNSAAGDLVLLDSVVTRVQPNACVRWTGACGHELLRLRQTQFFYCAVCSQTSSHCRQRLFLEVCVAANSVPTPVRLKVKSETAQVLLLGSPGQVSSDKSYNMIWAIGANLKCLALVLEVLKNPFDDVLEFLLEEL